MSMHINGLGNTYNDINTNSKQYKALKEKGWLSGVIENGSVMSPEEKMIYEIFGGNWIHRLLSAFLHYKLPQELSMPDGCPLCICFRSGLPLPMAAGCE